MFFTTIPLYSLEQKFINMKRNILLMALIAVLSLGINQQSQAQKFGVGGEVGVSILARAGANVAIPIGGVFEWGINDNMSLNSHLAFHIGPGAGNFSIFEISPEFRYYVTGTVFDGFYAGGFLGFGAAIIAGRTITVPFGGTIRTGGSRGFFSFGGVVGYEIPVGDKLIIDAGSQIGLATAGAVGFWMRPTVGVKVGI